MLAWTLLWQANPAACAYQYRCMQAQAPATASTGACQSGCGVFSVIKAVYSAAPQQNCSLLRWNCSTTCSAVHSSMLGMHCSTVGMLPVTCNTWLCFRAAFDNDVAKLTALLKQTPVEELGVLDVHGNNVGTCSRPVLQATMTAKKHAIRVTDFVY